MMRIPTDEETKLCVILDSDDSTDEEKEIAQARLIEIEKEQSKNNPFHQD